MAQTFFIADLHIGHKAICKYRPQFSNPKEHDECIIENWNKVVKKKHDTVWSLGDMFIKNNDYDFDNILHRLNGTIRIIPGNHDYMPYYPKEMIWNGLWAKYGYWLSHCPIHPNELRGKKNIHGHVHYKLIDDSNYICVCCEHINFTPISLEEIRNKYELSNL
jgi:calcineurin-like phosphoesterase family protein